MTVLERLGLPYLVTGSLATIFYGEPRFTNDVDIVVDLPLSAVSELCAAFPSPDFYVSPDYLASWAGRLGLTGEWRAVLERTSGNS